MPPKYSKRNLSSSSSSPKTGQNKKKYFVSPNRYASLCPDDGPHPEVFSPPRITKQSSDHHTTSSISEEPHTNTKVQIPPFYISQGYSFSTLKKELVDIVQPSNFYFKMTPNYLILRANTVNTYMVIFKYLTDNETIQFHTYMPKPLRPYSVFIRHLHPSTSVDDIQVSLSEKGHEAIRVTNILHRITKLPLSLFRVDLKVADNNGDLLKLDLLLNTKIHCELPRKKLAPPQCKDCQAYFHTQSYCHHSPRCVKCGDNHYSSECLKSPLDPAKCALCAGPHTASYKGCPVFKNILKNHNKIKKTKLRIPPASNIITPPSTFINPDANNKQYNVSYAKATANSQSNSHSQSSVDQSAQIIHKFIEEFKSILNPLLNAITSLINKITIPIISTP